jgi:gamma-glutamyltranspeptidase/glutathione hydrolase
VAVAFALAVTHPSAGNIGGGGFMIVRLKSGETHAIDFREAAPAAATTEGIVAMVKKGAYGYAATAVPGTVAGLGLAHERFGARPWAELLEPAVKLARKGHRLGPRQALVLGWAWPRLQADRAAREIWGRKGKPLAQGTTVRQLDLARTLEAIAKEGPRAFYAGPIARKIVAAMRAGGGLVTEADLAAYQAKLRAPLRFSYRGFTVDTMPPPSMGGVAFAQIMLSLERVRAHEAPRGSGLSHHLFAEAARRAYADRRRASADPDFSPPEAASLLAKLLDGADLEGRRPAIDRERATASTEIAAAQEAQPAESQQTTHFSVVDVEGNAVSCTYTLSAGFGAKVVVPGAGVVLSNALAAFTPAGPNEVAPGKRMQSSMTPAIAAQGGRLALVLGSPGGDTIPNTVAQVLRNLVDHGMTIDEAVESPRLHHQWLPDRVRVEQGNPPPRAALEELRRRGHTLDLDASPIGDANNILIDAAGVAWGLLAPCGPRVRAEVVLVVGVLGAHHHHRARRVARDPLSRRSAEQPLEEPGRVGADHDQIGAELGREPDDRPIGAAGPEMHGHEPGLPAGGSMLQHAERRRGEGGRHALRGDVAHRRRHPARAHHHRMDLRLAAQLREIEGEAPGAAARLREVHGHHHDVRSELPGAPGARSVIGVGVHRRRAGLILHRRLNVASPRRTASPPLHP